MKLIPSLAILMGDLEFNPSLFPVSPYVIRDSAPASSRGRVPQLQSGSDCETILVIRAVSVPSLQNARLCACDSPVHFP